MVGSSGSGTDAFIRGVTSDSERANQNSTAKTGRYAEILR